MLEHMADIAADQDQRRIGVQVIARAAEICRELATATDGLTTAELVERLGLSRPTVYRILRALMDEDFVRQVAAGRYAVGPAFLVIGGSSYGGLRHDLRPFMKDLSIELGETIDLAVLDSGEALFVDQYVAVQGLRVVAHMGARLPLYCTASGKALLAELSPGEAERELPETLEAYTPNTRTDRTALLRELEEVRRTGVAYDNEEYVMGVCAVATPVRDAVGAVGALAGRSRRTASAGAGTCSRAPCCASATWPIGPWSGRAGRSETRPLPSATFRHADA